MSWNKYPYTDFHELNQDWILQKIKEMDKSLSEFEALNKITFDGEWNITNQYPAWCIVNTNGGTVGYISIQPVPAGVTITNTDYWVSIVNYTATIADLQNRVVRLESDMSDVQEELDRMSNPKVIMMTDSFGENVAPNISTLVPSGMRWNSADYMTIVQGGSGFGPSAPYNYITNLQGKASDILSHFGSADAITDIIVTGGTNDSYYGDTKSDIIAGISAFETYVTATYPNAKITFIFTGWTDDATAVSNLNYANIVAAMDSWQTITTMTGRYFDIHNVLHRHALFTSDHIHPNTQGQEMLAEAICAVLNDGEYHANHVIDCTLTPETGVSVLYGPIRFHFELHDDEVSVRTLRPSKFELELAMQASTSGGEINNVKIGTLSDWLIGANGVGSTKLMTFAIVGYNGGAHCFPVQLTFQSGDVYIAVGNFDPSTTTYHFNAWNSECATFDSYNC